jgi:RNA polymerase sigma-70 factor (ECF subfamily)
MSDNQSLQTRASLLLRLRDCADAAAWRTFVEVYTPVIYGYCRRKGLQEADAADVTQDVLAEVARGMPAFRYQPERGRFRHWLLTVVSRSLGRFWARRGRQLPAGGELSDEDLAADGVWDEEFHTRLLRAGLSRIQPRFEPNTWAAFDLSWLQSQPAADVAVRLNIPVETVYVSRSRVLKALREAILELTDDLPQF